MEGASETNERANDDSSARAPVVAQAAARGRPLTPPISPSDAGALGAPPGGGFFLSFLLFFGFSSFPSSF